MFALDFGHDELADRKHALAAEDHRARAGEARADGCFRRLRLFQGLDRAPLISVKSPSRLLAASSTPIPMRRRAASSRTHTSSPTPSYKDYCLSLEYRWGEKKFAPRLHLVRDAGLLYHVHRERPSDWPACAEAQIQEGDTGDSWAVSSQVSSFVDPKTGRYALPENGGVPVTVGKDGDFKRTRHGRVNEYPGWNTLEVIVRGDRATHVVNGVVNMRVSDIKSLGRGHATRWVKLDHGKIALQAESAELFYRNIRVRPLTKADDMPPGTEGHRGVVPGAARK